MLLEAGRDLLHSHDVQLHNIEAVAGLRFFHDASQDVRIEARRIDTTRVHCRLLSDFVARDGRIVDPNRLNFSAEVIAGPSLSLSQPPIHSLTRIALPNSIERQAAVYPQSGAKLYVGWPLQRLKKVALVPGGLVGNISAPALIELAGSGRDVRGCRIPSAALDACLFAVGILAWRQIAPGAALPGAHGTVAIGPLAHPWRSLSNPRASDPLHSIPYRARWTRHLQLHALRRRRSAVGRCRRLRNRLVSQPNR